MAESTFKDDIEKMETSNLVSSNTWKKNIEMNKRSRDNLSEDETDERSTKKPRQQINTESVEKEDNNDHSIKNGNTVVHHMDSEEQNVAKDTIESNKLRLEKCKTDDNIDEKDKELSRNTNVVSDNTNERTKKAPKNEHNKEPEVVDGLELSVECASDNDSSESENDEGDEEKTKPRSKTAIVKHSPNDSELEVSASESETSEKHNHHTGKNDHADKTKNNEEKNMSSPISNDSESEENAKNDESDSDNHNEIDIKKKSPTLKQIATNNSKKNIKKTPGKKRQESSDDASDSDASKQSDNDDIEKSDGSGDDKWNATKKKQSSEKEDNQKKKSVAKKRGDKKLQNTKKKQVSLKENAILSEGGEKSNNSPEDESENEEKKIGKISDKSQNKISDNYDSDDSNEDGDSEKKAKGTEKKQSRFEDKVAHMKKFISAAGIKVKKYDDLWLNCKTNKAKIDRLRELLEKNGVSGRPTLEKCRKAKAKREQDNEIAELDPKNIISEVRITRSRNASTTKQLPTLLRPQVSPSRQQEIHKRIQYVVDSDSE